MSVFEFPPRRREVPITDYNPTMLSLDQARQMILAAIEPLPAETVSLQDSLGRVAAANIIAADDLVPFARSAMDGFAVRAADTAGATIEQPIGLPIRGNAFAEAGTAKLVPGAAMPISTGAPMPAGADAVIPIENVEHSCRGIRVRAPVFAGESVFPPAEDVRKGERLLERGEIVGGARIALLAFAGHAHVSVRKRPRISILASGNELVEAGAEPLYGQIRNSNAPALLALATESGAQARFAGVAPDDPATLRAMLESARAGADLIITTGGAGRGERDYMKATLADLGAEFLFREVAMRPGRPTGFATWRGVPVFTLAGNPAAVFVSFHLLVRAALNHLLDCANGAAPRLIATLRARVHGRPGMVYAVFAKASFGAHGLEVAPLPNQCSALVRTSAEANALLLGPEDRDDLQAGEKVEIEVLNWRDVAGRSPSETSSAVPTAAEKAQVKDYSPQ